MFTLGKKVNIYIVYEISKHCDNSSFPTLENCLFGAVCLAKNVDTDKCEHDGVNILDIVLNLIEIDFYSR